MSWQKLGTALTFGMAMTACGGTVVFKGKTPLTLQGELPPRVVLAPKRVEHMGDKIVIREKIEFDINKSTIREESHDLLKEVAELLKQKTNLKKVRVDGHASQDGPAYGNMVLSQRRARAVMNFLPGQLKWSRFMLPAKENCPSEIRWRGDMGTKE